MIIAALSVALFILFKVCSAFVRMIDPGYVAWIDAHSPGIQLVIFIFCLALGTVTFFVINKLIDER